MPELFDIVNVYDVASFQSTQISLNEYKQIDPLFFSDETAEQGNCSSFWVRQTNIISPDKSILVTGWSYGHKQPQKTVINLWDLVEQKCILQLPEYDGSLTALAFSPSGNYLIFSTNWATYVWNVKQKVITCQINYAWNAIVYPAVQDVIVLSDGMGQPGGLSGLWNIEQCEKIQEYSFGINYPVFSPNGALLAGTKDNRILISDAKTGELLKELDLPLNIYLDLSFSPDGRYLLLWDYGLLGSENNKNIFVLWAVKP
jgi:WD40 repeat protein